MTYRQIRSRSLPAPAPATGAGVSSRPSRRLLLGALAAAVALTLALVGASLLSGRGSGNAGADSIAGGPDIAKLFDGIPQAGPVLGSPTAPVTLVEYADLQCPYCAVWARDAFPAVVREYARTGKLRIVFRGLAFIGPESATALRTALAAGRQRKLWNVVELLYRNQGSENGGWVTDSFLRALGREIPGLDAGLMLAQRSLPGVTRQLEAAKREAELAGVTGTPTFELGPTGGALERLDVGGLDAQSFGEALAARL